jgi:hypothetical protein
MPQFRKPLYQHADGADEDRWRLVLDTDTNRLFVEHERKRGDMRGSGYGIDTDELDVSAFLSEQGPGRHELLRLLGVMFEERRETARARLANACRVRRSRPRPAA